MRRVEPAEMIDPRQQLGRDALHHPMHLAMNIGVQPAEVRHPGRGAHAAKEAVTLDQQRPSSRSRHGDRSRDACRPAAEHRHFIFAIKRDLARGLFDGFDGQDQVPGSLGRASSCIEQDYALPVSHLPARFSANDASPSEASAV
jgi:hypothetical protein